MGRCALVVGESGGYALGACKILSPTGEQIERICPMKRRRTQRTPASPEELRRQRQAFLTKLTEIIRKHRGEVLKSLKQ